MWALKIKLSRYLVFVFLLASTSAHSARDGLLDDVRSEGEIRISLAILPSLQINVVSQVSVDIRNVMVDNNFEEYVCITGQDSGRYQLIATGNAGGFELSGREGDRLPYEVHFNGSSAEGSFDELQSDEPSPVYNIATRASECAQSPNFKVQFRSEDLRQVRPGLYSGALTLLVSPL
ncbi:MAG: hypothetical protein JJ952_12900 [Pseudomonadales bacterium]|nr:hypothetical protein [Pseudomonadales bacterium]MBO6823276.1 hypothetical protein [Pseudomonadales bacterium]